MKTLYLDHNATTPVWPEVAAAMTENVARQHANPASQHAPGRLARRALEDARERIGAMLGLNLATAGPDRLLLTSGGTEANNLAIFGLSGSGQALADSGDPRPKRLIISSIEHPCILAAAEVLERRGWQVDRLRVSRDGVVNPAELEERLTTPARLVSVMLANHETGVLQPIAELAAICARHGVPMHTDAVQAAGKLPLDLLKLGVSALTISAHKFNGPPAIGGLAILSGVEIEPLLFGGFQQGGLRPGTESVPLAIGMQVALETWGRRREGLVSHLRSLTTRFEVLLLGECPDAVIHGINVQRLPQTSNIAFPGVDRQLLLLALDTAGVACSTGSACQSGSSEPSPVLTAMGLPAEQIHSSLRFSFGPEMSMADVELAVERISQCYKRLQPGNSSRKMPAAARGRG